MTDDEFRDDALAQLGRAFARLPADVRAELIAHMEQRGYMAEVVDAIRAADREAATAEAVTDEDDALGIELDDRDSEGLAHALIERLVSYASETGTELDPDECTIAALHLLMRCVGAYQHRENRLAAGARVMTVLPKLIADTLAAADEDDEIGSVN